MRCRAHETENHEFHKGIADLAASIFLHMRSTQSVRPHIAICGDMGSYAKPPVFEAVAQGVAAEDDGLALHAFNCLELNKLMVRTRSGITDQNRCLVTLSSRQH